MNGHEHRWYALYTRSRHEKQVEAMLRRQELETYLPLRRASLGALDAPGGGPLVFEGR